MVETGKHETRRRVSDVAAEQLMGQIAQGEYLVGSKLPSERILAQSLGVGRSSMREAVRTLQEQGVLRCVQGRGVFVLADRARRAGLDYSLMGGFTITDLFETRMAIEGKSAQLAAKRVTTHHGEVIDAILDAAGKPNVSHEEFVSLDRRFHRELSQASGNPLLLHIWDSIGDLFEEFSLKVVELPGRRTRAHQDHHAIADAVLAGNAELARQLAEKHIVTVQNELRESRNRVIER